jgi:uncharacterized protein YggU (UPF0235/DUF167 family)
LSTSSSDATPFSAAADGARVRIRLTPRASANRITGLVAEADQGVALKVMVTAVAEGGKANAALIALLARHWRLPKRDLAIVTGAADRRKVVHVAGAAATLLPVLEASLAPP